MRDPSLRAQDDPRCLRLVSTSFPLCTLCSLCDVIIHEALPRYGRRGRTRGGQVASPKFPAHALYGEEGVAGDQSTEHQWIVDPLDGTVNYFYGIPHFCVSIALRLRSEIIVAVIYDPIRDEMWTGQKGERPK